MGRDAASNRLVFPASDDNGDTWRDYAVSEAVINPYAIGGCREVTADGWIIGSFTDQTPEGGGKVYIFPYRRHASVAVFIKAGSTTNGVDASVSACNDATNGAITSHDKTGDLHSPRHFQPFGA